MAAPNITPTVTANSTCNGLTFTDSTTYTGSDITSAYVTQAIIRLDYNTTGSYLIYTFTVASNVITAATVSVNGATAVNILSQLSSTVFPQTNFNLSATYTNVTIPTVEDGIYYTTYTVSGINGGTGASFSYVGTTEKLNGCETRCCISGMFQKIDPDCGCSDKKYYTAMRAMSYYLAAQFSADVGNVDNAVAALNKASSICDQGCGCP